MAYLSNSSSSPTESNSTASTNYYDNDDYESVTPTNYYDYDDYNYYDDDGYESVASTNYYDYDDYDYYDYESVTPTNYYNYDDDDYESYYPTTNYSSRVYTGGDQIISEYTSGEKIVLGTMPTGWIFGGGTDIFTGGKYQGADVFANASSADVVNLNDATLSDIVAASESNNVISLAFNTGNVVAVGSSELLSAAFVLADGSAWRYNHATKSWQGA